MRVVSLVPSWTETLLNAGVEVVGRTRYCIHPEQKTSSIPIVGGTKDVSWDLVLDLKPDLVLLDKEENPLEMAQECPLPFLATHVSSLLSLQKELAVLGEKFENAVLLELSVDCLDILEAPNAKWDFHRIPGFLEWVHPATREYENVVYMIWKKPWMSIQRGTYIASVLEKLGAQVFVFPDEDKYPVIEIEDCKDSFFLFSSEPFPFQKKIKELRELSLEGALVDGECYSWFGWRSIHFLKKHIKT